MQRGEAKDEADSLGPQHTSKAVPSSPGCGESLALVTYPRKAQEPMSAWMGSHPVPLGSSSGWKPQQRCRDRSAGGSSWGLVAAECLDGPCSWLSRSSHMLHGSTSSLPVGLGNNASHNASWVYGPLPVEGGRWSDSSSHHCSWSWGHNSYSLPPSSSVHSSFPSPSAGLWGVPDVTQTSFPEDPESGQPAPARPRTALPTKSRGQAQHLGSLPMPPCPHFLRSSPASSGRP